MTTPLKSDLQKAIFLEEMRQLHMPGWEVLEKNDLLAFKSPVAAPFIDLVYGNITADAFEKVKEFYQKKPFMWLMPKEQDARLLSTLGFKGPDITFEMVKSLSDYAPYDTQPTIEIKPVRTLVDFDAWVSVAAEWLQVNQPSVHQFFTAWLTTGHYVAYLGCIEGRPVATSLVGFSELGAALYCIGTLQGYRRRGIGTAVTCACLEAAKLNNMPWAVLYGSEMGKPMYDKIGFRLTQVIHGYSYGH